ncbi:unnamed protein product [Somion occarium]|uniref:Uncharacterized protein n=1 Tax=Somion occarium TaxID=3059160 RepID=A0ABP1DLY6_9APHY
MEANFSCESIPNPITALAWMPPNLASQYEAIRFFFAAVLGAWIWDVVMSLPDELKMFKARLVSLPNFVYILARLTTGATILISFLFLSAPTEDCQRLVRINGWVGVFAIPLLDALSASSKRRVLSLEVAHLDLLPPLAGNLCLIQL